MIPVKAFLPIVVAVVVGCGATGTTPPAESDCAFDWLVGTWTTDDGATTERWTATPPGLEGESVTRRDGEVVFTETLAIRRSAAGFEYYAAPSGQAPHAFPLEACSAASATFSDPRHDWPQSLTYRRSGDTLTATAEGVENGEPRTATWTWRAQ